MLSLIAELEDDHATVSAYLDELRAELHHHRITGHAGGIAGNAGPRAYGRQVA